ncbi:hypothetical protein [Pricia sp.]|uniref:hypothetical protein n=1 Tax=Pricia sp. TaxID=2268138 RepID=UPI003593A523
MFSLLTLVNCKQREGSDQLNLRGDWYITDNTITDKFDYQEIYFDDNVFYIFQPSNYSINYAENYKFDGKYFYILDGKAQDTLKKFTVKMHDYKLELKGEKGLIEYSRIKNGNKLSHYVQKKIPKKDFEKDFTERMIKSGRGDKFLLPNN